MFSRVLQDDVAALSEGRNGFSFVCSLLHPYETVNQLPNSVLSAANHLASMALFCAGQLSSQRDLEIVNAPLARGALFYLIASAVNLAIREPDAAPPVDHDTQRRRSNLEAEAICL